MRLFPTPLFMATTNTKLVKNSILQMNYYQNFSKFCENFPTTCGFRPKARKINVGFLKSC